MTAVESLESHKQPFHPSHRPCKSRQTSGICTFPPPDDESSLVYRLNAKSNPETINPWVGQNKMPNWTNFSCQKQPGGFKYRPTTSVSFSRNFGSRDSLNVLVRCGLMLWLFQTLLMVDLLMPWVAAMSRQLQCVWPFGFDCKVASRTALTRSGP